MQDYICRNCRRGRCDICEGGMCACTCADDDEEAAVATKAELEAEVALLRAEVAALKMAALKMAAASHMCVVPPAFPWDGKPLRIENAMFTGAAAGCVPPVTFPASALG